MNKCTNYNAYTGNSSIMLHRNTVMHKPQANETIITELLSTFHNTPQLTSVDVLLWDSMTRISIVKLTLSQRQQVNEMILEGKLLKRLRALNQWRSTLTKCASDVDLKSVD